MAQIKDFFRGDTLRYNLIVKDENGNTVDITGAKIFFTLKNDLNEPDSQAAIQVKIENHTDPQHGKTKLIVPAEMTNQLKPNTTYYYDIQIVDAEGNVKTLAMDKVRVLPDVTRSIT